VQNLEVLNLEGKMKQKNNFAAVLIVVSITFLLLIKVYISNKIYFISRDIQKISTKIDALKEERSILKLKIEKLQYKYQISDPLFNYEIDKKEIQPKEKEVPSTQEERKKEELNNTSTPQELFNTI